MNKNLYKTIAGQKRNFITELFFSLAVMASISIYEKQHGFFILLCSFVLLGYLFIRFVLHSKNVATYRTFFFFIGVYGILTILTHIELIEGKDPNEYYYIHYDAAGSFYAKTVDYVKDMSWAQLLNGSIFHYLYFADYPLAAILFGIVTKLGQAFSIVDLRLLLRCHVFVFAAIVAAMITDIQIVRGINPIKAKKWAFIFGMISYLFVTSCVFSRDLHVCFAYTLMGYIILLPRCNMRLLKMVVALLVAMGFRPVSGVLAILFILGYYSTQKTTIKYFFVPILVLLVVTLFISNGAFVEDGLSRLNLYAGMAESQSGGIFGIVYHLPFPINQIGMLTYMLLMPLPATKYLLPEYGGSLLTLPFLLSPYLMSLLFVGGIWLGFHRDGKDKVVIFYMLFAMIVFMATIFGSPDLRRSFAAIPGAYMAFCIYREKVPKHVYSFCKNKLWPMIILINVIFLFYLNA